MTHSQYPIDTLSTACGDTETETETETNTETEMGEREREKNRNNRQRRKRKTEIETTDRRRPPKPEVIVPHQGYIAMDTDVIGNRIHLTQAWFCDEESKITIVGRENLETLIAALSEAREHMV